MQKADENELMTATELAKHLPGKPHYSTILRWRRDGQVAANGERIKLNSCRIGANHYFTLADVRDYGRRLAQADREGEEAKANKPTPAEQRRQHNGKREAEIEAAEKGLAEAV